MKTRRARHELYRFYDIQGNLLYVGITGNVQQRVSQHRGTQPWWDYVGTMTVQRFESRVESEIAERVAIRDEEPLFNIARHSPDSLTGHGFRPVISVCWVCHEPVVEQLDDEYDPEVLTRDHLQCSESIVHAFRSGVEHAKGGGS